MNIYGGIYMEEYIWRNIYGGIYMDEYIWRQLKTE
jgi:hypothetical protein